MDSVISRIETDTATGAVCGDASEALAPAAGAELALGTALWQVIADLDPATRALWGRCVWANECPCRPAAEHDQSSSWVIASLVGVARRLDLVLASFPAGVSVQTAATGRLYAGPGGQGAFEALIEGLHQHPHCSRALTRTGRRLRPSGRAAEPGTCSARHHPPGQSSRRPDQTR